MNFFVSQHLFIFFTGSPDFRTLELHEFFFWKSPCQSTSSFQTAGPDCTLRHLLRSGGTLQQILDYSFQTFRTKLLFRIRPFGRRYLHRRSYLHKHLNQCRFSRRRAAVPRRRIDNGTGLVHEIVPCVRLV